MTEEAIEALVPRFAERRNDGSESTLELDLAAVVDLNGECQRLGLDTRLPELIESQPLRTAAAFGGDRDISALHELIGARNARR